MCTATLYVMPNMWPYLFALMCVFFWAFKGDSPPDYLYLKDCGPVPGFTWRSIGRIYKSSRIYMDWFTNSYRKRHQARATWHSFLGILGHQAATSRQHACRTCLTQLAIQLQLSQWGKTVSWWQHLNCYKSFRWLAVGVKSRSMFVRSVPNAWQWHLPCLIWYTLHRRTCSFSNWVLFPLLPL
jgi:hypothetical protein